MFGGKAVFRTKKAFVIVPNVTEEGIYQIKAKVVYALVIFIHDFYVVQGIGGFAPRSGDKVNVQNEEGAQGVLVDVVIFGVSNTDIVRISKDSA